MNRVLITGITGFVGEHLAKKLLSEGYEVWGTSRSGSPDFFAKKHVNIVNIDFHNEVMIRDFLNKVLPDQIYHLAGQSSVKESWENKKDTFDTNVNMFINLLEAVRKSEVCSTVKVLSVGSSEEYGKVQEENIPIHERVSLNPISPYGISKATASMLARHYFNSYGVHIVHVRPFNHIGPGQRLGFVVSDFSNQIVRIERGEQDNVIKVGNLEAQRDFTDVRDIVAAYVTLLEQNTGFGDVINVCSSKAIRIQKILDDLVSLSKVSIDIEIDKDRLRPADIPIYVGDNSKIVRIGWEPRIPLTTTLNDVLQYQRDRNNRW